MSEQSTRRQLLLGAATGAAILLAANRTTAQTANAAPKIKAVAFDMFTIFDPFSVDIVMEESFPGKGKQYATAWRTRIFEYCWLRTLNRNYVDFWQVLDDALTYSFQAAKTELKPDVRAKLLNAFLQFKPRSDSVAALRTMQKAGLRMAPLSTFTEKMLITNCKNAGIEDVFEQYLTCDRVKAFKPDPRSYQMAEDAFKLKREEIVFAAFGGWDASGAKSFGLNTFWVNPTSAPVEELGVRPDRIGTTLTELATYVTA